MENVSDKKSFIKIEVIDEFRFNKYGEPYKKEIIVEPFSNRELSESEYIEAVRVIDKERKKALKSL